MTSLTARYHSDQQCAGTAFFSSLRSKGPQGPAQESKIQSVLLARRQQRCQAWELLAQAQPGEAEASCQVTGNSSVCYPAVKSKHMEVTLPTGALQPLLIVHHGSPEVYSTQAVQQLSMVGVTFSKPSPIHCSRSCYADTPTGQPRECVHQQHCNHSTPWHTQVVSASAHGSPQHPPAAVGVEEKEQSCTILQQGPAVGQTSSNSSSSIKCDLAAFQACESVVGSPKQHCSQSNSTADLGTVFVDAVYDYSLLPDWHEFDDELSSPTGRRLIEMQEESSEVEQHQPQQQLAPEHSTQRQQQEGYVEGREWAAGGSKYAASVNRIMSPMESITSTVGEGPMEGQLYEVLRLSVLGPIVETVRVRPVSNRPQGGISMDVEEVFSSRFTDEWPEDAEDDARICAHDDFGRSLYVSGLPGNSVLAGSSTSATHECDWGLNDLVRQGSEGGYMTAVEAAEGGEKLGMRGVSMYVASCPAVAFGSTPWHLTDDSMVPQVSLGRPATG